MLTSTMLVCLGFAAVAVYVAWFYLRKRDCPWANMYPIVGALPAALANYSTRYDWAVRVTKQLGPVWRMYIPGTGVVTGIAHPDDVQHVLKGRFDSFVKGDFFDSLFHELLGNGIFNSDGSVWRKQRKIASHMFSINSLRHYMTGVFTHHSDTLRDKLLGLEGKEVDIQDCFYRFTLDSVGEIAFGVNVNSQLKQRVPFAESFDYCQLSAQARVYKPGWRRVVKLAAALRLPFFQGFARNLKVLDSFARQVISARREDPHLSERQDLLSRFMCIKDEDGNPMSDQYLRNQVMNYTIAGRDTTAQALSWTVYRLLSHPSEMAKMVAEVDSVLATHELDYETAVNHLPYTLACVKESLRLNPSVPVDFKTAVQDEVLPSQKIRVPKGTLVMYMPYVMGRMEYIWGPDAPQWRPERWIEMAKRNYKPNAYQYPVFNAGPRTCLGQNMALLEATIAVATLFKSLSFDLVSKNVTYEPSVTMPIRNGLIVVPRRRGEGRGTTAGASDATA